MAQHTITVHLHMEMDFPTRADGSRDYSRREWVPALHKYDFGSEEDRVYVGPRQVTVEVPDDFNPIPAQVAALEAKKLEALAEYQKTVAEIQERLSKLLAITNGAAA